MTNKTQKQYWEILKMLVKMDFSLRYQNSFLGFIWVFLKPFLIFLVLLAVFTVFGSDIEHFQVYLLLGIILFQFFSDGTNFGMYSILGKANILLKCPLDKTIVVLGSVINAIIFFLFSFFLFIGFLIFYQIFPSLHNLFQFTVIFIALVFFVLGFSFLLSFLVIRFRDMQAIWEICLTALFYLVPIFYSITIVPEKIQKILFLNPLTNIIIYAREVLIYGNVINWESLFFLLGATMIWSGFCFFIFKKFTYRLMENL